MRIRRHSRYALSRLSLAISLLSSMGCTSLEGILYQEKSLEQAECRVSAKNKYTELMTYMGQACFLHQQMAAMTAMDNDEGLPSLQRRIYQACLDEESTTLETILEKSYGANPDGDLPGITADSVECRAQQSGRRAL